MRRRKLAVDVESHTISRRHWFAPCDARPGDHRSVSVDGDFLVLLNGGID